MERAISNMEGKLILSEPDAEALNVAAIQCWQVGDMAGACALWRQAIALNPDVAVYHANLGVALKQVGAGQEHITCYQRAIQLAPEEPDYHSNLAAALNEAGLYVEGEAEARLAIAFLPTRAEFWFNLGCSLAGQNRWLDAAAAFDMAGQHRDAWPDAIEAAGKAWRSAGEWLQAAKRFQRALQCLPVQPTAARVRLLRAWAQALMRMHRYADAEACLRDALLLNPDAAELLTDLGNALNAQNCFDEALIYYRRVVELRPDLAGGYCNLGTVAQSLGDYETAIAYYRKTLEISPSVEPAWTNLGNCLTYSPRHEPKDVLATFQAFDSQLAQPLFDIRHHVNDCNPRRRLKVGYVSPDFRRHAVAYFALPLIEGHRREQVEVFCYYNHRQDDEWTAAFRRAADHWLNCSGVSDAELAERIRADEIDILVDLSGHTENNRLLVFARKPAPVQITWMGYVTTTGLSTMNWRVTHVDADPEGVDPHYSEKLWRLPGTMWCYRPLPGMPEVTSAPVLKNSYVTFGSFNRYSKNSPLVLETWATILNQIPDSRLVICVPEGSIRERMASFFTEQGIHPERILAFAKLSHDDFWKLHGEVDIALDSFPFAGGTTTCETLWLGVPLVTVTGSAQPVSEKSQTFPARFASKMGQAFLTNIGVPELVAETLPQYVNIAVQLARDVPRLVRLRQSLRSRMAAAPLTDEARFVDEMEQAYREMWRQWCVQQSNYKKNENPLMKTFLHVGCGPKRKDKTTPGFNVPDWQELRLDIDKNVAPDIVGTMLDMSAVADASVDALFSSHNIEHLYPHEVPKALSEFKRVLKPDGFVVITCPDLQSVCALIAEDRLTDPAYDSPAGPIAPLDILYGHRPAMAQGNLYMAHRCGFTQKVLIGTLKAAGFAAVAAMRREHPKYDLWALATVQPIPETELLVLAQAHFPK